MLSTPQLLERPGFVPKFEAEEFELRERAEFAPRGPSSFHGCGRSALCCQFVEGLQRTK